MGTRAKVSVTERRALDAYVKLMRAADTVSVLMKTEMASYGLTWTQFAVLEALYHLGPLTQSDMCAKILKSGGNLTLVVNNLERDGLVRRRRCEKDRRRIYLELTDTGRKRIAGVFPRHAHSIDQLMHHLDAAELEALGTLCKKLGLAIRPVEEPPLPNSANPDDEASAE